MNINNCYEEVIWKYLKDKTSDDEIQALSGWLEKSKNNRCIFTAMKKAYIEIEANSNQYQEQMEKARDKFFDQVGTIENNRRVIKSNKELYIRKTIIQYAAAVFIGLLVGVGVFSFIYYKTIPDSNELCEVHVPYGGMSTLALPDGSKVWLNAGSTLKYNRDFDIKSREIYIEGEAFFDVEKRKHPLVVHTSHFDIHVLGTAFNVKSYPEEDNIETTLVEGNIRIESSKYEKPLLLKPNQKLTYLKATHTITSTDIRAENNNLIARKEATLVNNKSRKTDEIEIFENVNVEETTSWKDGKLVINNESLQLLARKLERKYDIEFKFESEDLKEYTYSGTLRNFPLEQVLKALELTSPIKYTIREKTVYLSYNKDFNPIISKKKVTKHE